MDLIPIIEYTLLIFIGLLLLVVLTSYLLFALRKNKNLENEEIRSAREYIPVEPEVKYLIPVRNQVTTERKYHNRSINEDINSQRPSRYTILNSNTENASGFTQERVTSFEYRFAPTKSKDAFAMFK